MKWVCDVYKRRKSQSHRAKMDIEVRFESDKPLIPGSSHFIELESLLSSMLTASNEALGYLKEEYPHIRFDQTIKVSLEKYATSQTYIIRHGQMTTKKIVQLIKLFKLTPLHSSVETLIVFSRLGLIKRTDTSATVAKKKRVYYMLGPQKLASDLFAKLT